MQFAFLHFVVINMVAQEALFFLRSDHQPEHYPRPAHDTSPQCIRRWPVFGYIALNCCFSFFHWLGKSFNHRHHRSPPGNIVCFPVWAHFVDLSRRQPTLPTHNPPPGCTAWCNSYRSHLPLMARERSALGGDSTGKSFMGLFASPCPGPSSIAATRWFARAVCL